MGLSWPVIIDAMGMDAADLFDVEERGGGRRHPLRQLRNCATGWRVLGPSRPYGVRVGMALRRLVHILAA